MRIARYPVPYPGYPPQWEWLGWRRWRVARRVESCHSRNGGCPAPIGWFEYRVIDVVAVVR